jgi:hypothetical protein
LSASRLCSSGDDDGNVGRAGASSTACPIHSLRSRVGRFPSVTLPLRTLPFASPSTGRTQTPKEADMKTDYAIIHKNWNGIEIEIRWIADYVSFDDGQSMAHLEVESVKPARAPLPITETGYRSHFINRSNVDHMGGPEAYVEAWIDEMSRTHAWREIASASRQLALF